MQLAPWGCPPTPPLPKWWRQNFADRLLPESIRAVNPTIRTVGELSSFWTNRDTLLSDVALQSLSDCVGPAVPPSDFVVIPSGFDRNALVQYPLRTRTRNALGSAGLFTGTGALTVGTLLGTRRFGRMALIELMCVVEAALDTQTPLQLGALTRATTHPTLQPDTPPTRSTAAVRLLARLFAAIRDFRGARTVGDALRHDLPGIVDTMHMKASLDELPIDELAGNESLSREVLSRVHTVIESLHPSRRPIIEYRIVRPKGKTLADLGVELGVTNERVRQIQTSINQKLRAAVRSRMFIIADLLRANIDSITTPDTLRRVAQNTFPNDPQMSLSVTVARHFLTSELGYNCVDGICVDQDARSIIDALRTKAPQVADDAGLIDIDALTAELPDVWNSHLSQLLQLAQFHQIGKQWALRDTGKARVKAAILEIGRPATKSEIGQICQMSPSQIGAHLSVIRSVARADKERWGLRDWISDEYDGIVQEIMQRIRKDGGVTPVEDLLDDIPRRFGVKESSVYAYLNTPRFVRRDGCVSIASDPRLRLRDLEDVIDGRTHDGHPYWTFTVEDRHFDGYSISPFPPELARQLGCEPDGSIMAEVAAPITARAVSVNWPLHSTTGANLGRISEALTLLGATAGERVHLVLAGSGRVMFQRSVASQTAGEAREPVADEYLRRIKDRQRF